jgi:hypothetical protein
MTIPPPLPDDKYLSMQVVAAVIRPLPRVPECGAIREFAR